MFRVYGGAVFMKKARLKASYTIEAAMIIPLVFTTILISVKSGVILHEKVKEAALSYANMKEIDAVSQVRTMKNVNIVLEE